jgi:hypothetical protein
MSALSAATERRSALVEALASIEPPSALALAEHGPAIADLDARLSQILLAGQRAMRRVLDVQPVYDRTGRMRGGRR